MQSGACGAWRAGPLTETVRVVTGVDHRGNSVASLGYSPVTFVPVLGEAR